MSKSQLSEIEIKKYMYPVILASVQKTLKTLKTDIDFDNLRMDMRYLYNNYNFYAHLNDYKHIWLSFSFATEDELKTQYNELKSYLGESLEIMRYEDDELTPDFRMPVDEFKLLPIVTSIELSDAVWFCIHSLEARYKNMRYAYTKSLEEMMGPC
jgi:hypothetical protein